MSKLYRVHTVFRQSSGETAQRYTLAEDLAEPGFAVLHCDFLRPNMDERTKTFLAGLTMERMLEADPAILLWRATIAAAIAAHDEDFAEIDSPEAAT